MVVTAQGALPKKLPERMGSNHIVLQLLRDIQRNTAP
jgi:hypothetical protein